MLSNVCCQKFNITRLRVIGFFLNLNIGLEVFLNLFPCVYIKEQCKQYTYQNWTNRSRLLILQIAFHIAIVIDKLIRYKPLTHRDLFNVFLMIDA